MNRYAIVYLLSCLLFSLPGAAQNATVPGELSAPYPTVINLAIEWKIAGDDNLNGVVEVEYRRAGETAWHRAMPLRRVPAGASAGTRPIYKWENKHSGSIFDLRPDTEYEIRLRLTDPDGGSTERTLRARTRPVPRDPRKPRLVRVDPRTLAAAGSAAHPGDVLALADGSYGDFEMTRDGEPSNPIVIRSRTGRAVFTRVSLKNRKYVHLEGVSVDRKPDPYRLEDHTGGIDLLGGESLSVRRCDVRSVFGIVANKRPGARNCYIADNTVTGAMIWEAVRMGDLTVDGKEACIGEGIEMTGPGNVICHNRVTGFRDNISTMEDTYVEDQRCIDIYNNDLYRALDDGVECDFAMGNCRVLRNRLTNCTMGLSSQPGLGGPTYFIRNAMYNLILSPFKLSRRTHGDVILHNTAIKVGNGFGGGQTPCKYVLYRNNLVIGGEGFGKFGNYSNGPGLAVNLGGADSTVDADYDGIGVQGVAFQGRFGPTLLKSFDDLRSLTTEKHAVLVDMSVFNGVPFPNPPIPERERPDLRLKPGSVAVDAGVPLPNINDGFAGKAPDLGAYELGRPAPHYGPRPAGVDEARPRP